MRKNLPVKIFNKREFIDECSVEGMAGNKLPKWVLSGDMLHLRADQLISELEMVNKKIDTRVAERNFIPVTITAYMNEDATAKSHRSKIAQVFDTKQENNIIGVISDNALVIKIKDTKTLNQITNKIHREESNALAISAIEEISLFEPKISYNPTPNNKIKVRLIDYDNYELNLAVSSTFEKLCIENNLKCAKTMYTDSLTIYDMEFSNADNFKWVEEFEGLYSIEDMPTYHNTKLLTIENNNTLENKEYDSNKEYPIVGVMDSGISENKYLSNWLLDDKNTSFLESDLIKEHGTFVAGIITYGDQLSGENFTGVNGCKVFDSTIFSELSAISQTDLVRNIETTLKRYGDKIKIWNLSIGTREEADLDNFSELGIALDFLQDKYDVIICKSAGNCDNFVKGAPKSRISKSADSVRAIVVGSIAQKQEEKDLVEENYPSPFTRVGRGPNYIIKPDLVHYGGNAYIDNTGNGVGRGVHSFNAKGEIIENAGTSFSTPRVSTILAGIQNKLDGEFDPLLIKGLAIHSGKYPSNIKLPMSEKVRQLGFGVPTNINDALYNSPNEITLIMRDQITKGEFTEILDFPYPSSMVEDGRFYGQVTVTVIYNSILDPSQGAEYCQSDLKVKLGTYDKKVDRDIRKSHIKNPIGKEGGQNILSSSCYSKKALRNCEHEFGSKERLLIKYDDKFYPVKKYVVDLDEMTSNNKMKYLGKDRKWYLKIEGLFRDSIIRKYEKSSQDLVEDYCIIITITDPKNKDNHIYNEVTNILEYNNFYHSNINIKQDINITVNNLDSTEDKLTKLINDIMENN